MELNERISRIETALGLWPTAPDVPQNQPIVPIEITIDLKDADLGPSQIDGHRVIYGETDYYKWAWVHVGQTVAGQRYRVTFKNVNGDGIVSGCCSEWDVDANLPKLGDAQFYIESAERSQYSVRVMGHHNWPNQPPLHMAIGFFTVRK
ncbi:hypothetical protein [Bacillus cereus group sp. BceL212]|uniref:hypothetical protein n=1 Tax=Bacillus cereus group sp. BceL212 TaxID=3445018 RepID=UPI0032F6098B|nr:hypothetical protein [Bacillus cereus]